MNRRRFLTFLGIAPAAPLLASETAETAPIHPEEWWVDPGTYTSGYVQVIDPDWDGNPTQWTMEPATSSYTFVEFDFKK